MKQYPFKLRSKLSSQLWLTGLAKMKTRTTFQIDPYSKTSKTSSLRLWVKKYQLSRNKIDRLFLGVISSIIYSLIALMLNKLFSCSASGYAKYMIWEKQIISRRNFTTTCSKLSIRKFTKILRPLSELRKASTSIFKIILYILTMVI